MPDQAKELELSTIRNVQSGYRNRLLVPSSSGVGPSTESGISNLGSGIASWSPLHRGSVFHRLSPPHSSWQCPLSVPSSSGIGLSPHRSASRLAPSRNTFSPLFIGVKVFSTIQGARTGRCTSQLGDQSGSKFVPLLRGYCPVKRQADLLFRRGRLTVSGHRRRRLQNQFRR